MALITGEMWEVETNIPSGFTFSRNTISPTGLSGPLTFTRSTTGARINSAGVLETIAINQPRFTHDPLTRAPRGILIEGGNTNSLLHTEAIDNAAWNPPSANAAITPNVSASRSGEMTFDRLTSDGTNNRRKQGVAHTSGTLTWFGSMSVRKQAAAATVEMRIGVEVGGTAFYTVVRINAVTGAATRTEGTGEFGVIEYKDHWRLWAAVTDNNSGNTSRMMQVTIVGTGEPAEVGEYQFEPNVMTSYTPSGAAQGVKAADIISGPRTIQGGAYSAVWDARVSISTPQSFSRRLFSMHDGTTNNLIHVFISSTNGVAIAVTTGGVSQATLSLGTVTAGARFKLAFRVKANDIAAVITGGTVQTDTSAALPPITTLTVGGPPSGIGHWSSTIAALNEHNGVALSDADLLAAVAL